MKQIKLMLGDNMESLKKLPDNSIDSVVTDAPYGLGKEQDMNIVLKDWIEKGYSEIKGKGFMGKEWDAYVPQPLFWKEIYRVLKPGGHILCFFGTRTYDIGTMAMRLAGFEIRDQIMWIYGSGFPKSHNIGKNIDKKNGDERKVIGRKIQRVDGTLRKVGATGAPFVDKDGKSFSKPTDGYIDIEEPGSETSKKYEGWGTALKPANEPICLARKPLSEKTIVDNVIKWGTGGINVDGCRIGTESISSGKSKVVGGGQLNGENTRVDIEETFSEGRFPANILFDESAAEMLDEQSGISKSNNHKSLRKGSFAFCSNYEKEETYRTGFDDKGGASRFFFKCSYNFLEQNEYKMKNLCQNNYKLVQYVQPNGLNIHQITELIAQINVEERLKDKLVLLVKSATNQSEKCVMYIVANLVAIGTGNMASQLTQDFIRDYKNYILIQNLAQIVEIQDNIDTTQTTQDLMKLFGSVLLVIEKNIQLDQEQEVEEQKSEQLKSNYRFRYIAKVSKKERNLGLDDSFDKETKGYRPGEALGGQQIDVIKKNTHPTLKPINLMTYLCRLITPPGGIVLDPFMGSGSTGISACLEGFRFVGMELDEDYFKIAEARVNNFEEYRKLLK